MAALPAEINGYFRVDCFGGLNQMRRDFCDGAGIARLLNATPVFCPSLKRLHIGTSQDV
ncbi:hypothetical protein RCOM_0898860 [Ricinus communis]|uniref:Uncharacterized protein n=1 Tax=Ricinus communis TaxID=3988 RepID=B9RV40_RICCO|nr:hypothetical protein RCOM_0898860 [Ricinus communis]